MTEGSRGVRLRICAAALALCLGAGTAPPSAAQPADGVEASDDLDDLLGGFEDESLEDPLGGFEDASDDDVLGGFGDEDETFTVDTSHEEPEEEPWWDLSGSIDFSPSVNYIPHDSSTGTSFTGISRLRTRLNTELDIELPYDWEMRTAAFIFYDPIYAIRGREQYTSQVLELYEWEVDFLDVYVQGNLTQDLDLKFGRQVVIWGRSDTIRVLDILNPLDNREPGRVDIEDIRRPVSMVKLDYWIDKWNLSAIFIPEIRFGLDPAYGSDFFVDASEFLPPMAPQGIADAINTAPEQKPRQLTEPEFAVAATGTYSGWDISLHGAYLWDDATYLIGSLTDPTSLQYEHGRIWMGGLGGNYLIGSWLLKAELAYLDGVNHSVPDPMTGVFDVLDHNRVDAMVGVEYYGFQNTSIALEVANRHFIDFDPRLVGRVEENRQETAFRITRNFLHETIEATGVVLMFGNPAQDGALVRLSVDYDVFDAFTVGGGILIFAGLPDPIRSWNDNDRVFMRVKYSF